jgi:uncharacterized RDD family membrane protein YckC
MAQPYAPSRDPTAVLGRRAAALVIDLLFLAVIGMVLFAAATHHSYYKAPPNACSQIHRTASSICLQVSDRVYVWDSSAYSRVVLLVVIAGFLDLVVLQTLTGASVGKLCVGLRVIEQPGNEARFLRVLGRWVFLAVDLGCFLVGLVTTLVTHPHRRVGDLVCGTYVVSVGSVGITVGLPDPYAPVQSTTPSAYGAPPGAPVPPGWGTSSGWATVPPPAPVPTPPGTSPTTPGEWGAVARPGPALVRTPHWEIPPETAAPATSTVRDGAPQWAAPPGPKPTDDDESEHAAAAEPMHAPEAAADPLAAVPQWSPIVPLTTKDETRTDDVDTIIGPPPPPPALWRPAAPTSRDPEEAPTPPAPEPPAEPPPPPPTEPPPPPPAAEAGVEADTEHAAGEPEPAEDVPWWDAGS